MKITPLNGNDEDAVDLPVPALSKKQGKILLKESYAVLDKLDKYDTPSTPTETYLDERSGKYVRMLEGLVDVAADAGLIETTSMLLFGLLRLTKLGRQKAEVTVSGVPKLREESDMKQLSDDELAAIISRVGKPNA